GRTRRFIERKYALHRSRSIQHSDWRAIESALAVLRLGANDRLHGKIRRIEAGKHNLSPLHSGGEVRSGSLRRVFHAHHSADAHHLRLEIHAAQRMGMAGALPTKVGKTALASSH